MKIIVPVLFGLFLTPSLQAQDDCTYDKCAMRIETDAIAIGQTGATKVKLRALRTPDLAARFAASDSAMAQYRIVAANHVSGNVFSIVGGLLMGFGVIAADNDHRIGSDAVVIGSSVTGVVAAIVGGIKVRKARNALARAVWWYNRDLPR